MDEVESILVVEEDIAVPPAKWWTVPGQSATDEATTRTVCQEIATALGIGKRGQLGLSSSKSQSRPWEVARFVGSFVHALEGKMDVAGVARGGNASQGHCFESCLCYSRQGTAAAAPDVRLCDVAGGSLLLPILSLSQTSRTLCLI